MKTYPLIILLEGYLAVKEWDPDPARVGHRKFER